MSSKVRRAKFYPIAPLDGKRNLKKITRINPDGSRVERVYLDVPDMRHREYLICMHYLRHITRHFLRDDIGINLVSRDNPWDFKIELSNESSFNVEIVSIADHEHHFENNKREERYNQCRSEKKISLHELKKLLTFFPDEKGDLLVKKYLEQGFSSKDLVPNPYFKSETTLFISATYESGEKLDALLKQAIQKKADKNHHEKESTILIVDNRTGAYDVDDYFDALDIVVPFAAELPFPEVWFYTGYFSDDDCNNAEFSFAPIKVTHDQDAVLKEMVQSGNVDSSGRYVWSSSSE